MRLKPLDKVIKSTRRRSCPFCFSKVSSEILINGKKFYQARNRIVNVRVFSCLECKASFCYERDQAHFKIESFQYTLGNFTMYCRYKEDEAGFDIVYDPEPDKPWVDNQMILQSEELIPFPTTKDKIESRLSLYITFS